MANNQDAAGGTASCGGDVAKEAADGGARDAAAAPVSDAANSNHTIDATDAIDASQSVDVSDDAGGYPGCRWPAYLDLTDANALEGPCLAATHLLACTYGGVNIVCVSDDLTCPHDGVELDASVSCHDVCEPGEYGVRCGFVPPPPPITGGPPTMEGPFPPPPASCHFTNIDLDELYVECCPCGS